MPATPSLPDDIDVLKALLLQRDGELQSLRQTVTTLELALSVRTLEIEQLTLQIAKLKRISPSPNSLITSHCTGKPFWNLN